MRLVSFFAFLLFPLAVSAGIFAPVTIQDQEKEAVHLYRTLTSRLDFDTHDSIALSFRGAMLNLLKNESSLTYPFDSLRRYLAVSQSADGRLRTFSWDEFEGGTWHNMTTYAQFRGGDGKLRVQQLDTDMETETGEFTDVRVYSIHQVDRNGRTAYLLLGAGTHGGGLHHAEARLLTIGSAGLEFCKDAFDGKEELVSEVPRTYPIDLQYDEKKQVLSYNDYIWSDASSGKTRCLHATELILENGRFRKK